MENDEDVRIINTVTNDLKDEAFTGLYGMAIFLLHIIRDKKVPKKEVKSRIIKLVDDMYREFGE